MENWTEVSASLEVDIWQVKAAVKVTSIADLHFCLPLLTPDLRAHDPEVGTGLKTRFGRRNSERIAFRRRTSKYHLQL